MHMGANTSRCWRGYAAGQGNDMWNDALLHILGVVGTRLRKAAVVCDTVLDSGRRVPAGRGPSPTFETPEVLTPLRSGIARRDSAHLCPTSGGG